MKKIIIPIMMLVIFSMSVMAASWSGASSAKVDVEFSLKISDAIVYKITIPSGCEATNLQNQLTGNILRASSGDTPRFKCTSLGNKVFTGEFSNGDGWNNLGSKTVTINEDGPEVCTETCGDFGYECDTWNICETSTNCGSCSGEDECISGKCTQPPEGCTDTCNSRGYECGIHKICDEFVTCGSCLSTQSCNTNGQCVTGAIAPTCPDTGLPKQFWQEIKTDNTCGVAQWIFWVGGALFAFLILSKL